MTSDNRRSDTEKFQQSGQHIISGFYIPVG